ncbi:MAG TPA: hypothetical protein VHQ94_08870 [Pyrinomonadaceae bacterium]|jgi:hypothetical protein|nr:hypothetical protein [Pyrinomonadaceae bacterium]
MKLNLINRGVAIAILVLPLLLAGGTRVFAQTNPNAVSNKEMRDLVKRPGKLVGEAKSARPNGDLKLTGFRVEEIELPRSMSVQVQGQPAVVNKAWRVTVNGGPFPVRALPAVIWIDDQIVGNGVENETLTQITAITFDGSLIREGGVVSISYGEDKQGRQSVSQRLQLKREGGNQ